MSKVDARDALKVGPFTWRADKDGKVTVYHLGRLARVLSGQQAARLLRALQGADPFAAQLALAKATGNFKRGNERRSIR